jgi:hypothetical protein
MQIKTQSTKKKLEFMTLKEEDIISYLFIGWARLKRETVPDGTQNRTMVSRSPLAHTSTGAPTRLCHAGENDKIC